MSKQRATELRKIRDELRDKFSEACKQLDHKIDAEDAEEANNEKAVNKAVGDMAKAADSTAAGIAVARMFPRRGGPAA